MAVPYLADGCRVEVIGRDVTSDAVAIYHCRPDKAQLLRDISELYPTRSGDGGPVSRVLKTGEP